MGHMEQAEKGWAWMRYIRERKVAYHNDRPGRQNFCVVNLRRARELEEKYPDFKQLFTEQYGNRYDVRSAVT